MNRIKTTVTAVAAMVVLAGCGAADEATEPVPDDPTTSTATTAQPSGLPPASPTPARPAPTAASPSGVLSLAESCGAVLDDQQGAVDTLQSYARNPLSSGVDAQDFEQLRSELLAGELSAPEPLRQELNTQVGVLNSIVQGLQDGNVQNVDIGAFQRARDRITDLCEETAR